MRKALLCLSAAAMMWANAGAQESPMSTPGCAGKNPQQCVDLALDAMGGRDRLEQIKTVRLTTIGHTALAEQSYRPDPFITSYERGRTTLDLANQRVLREATLTWPESDPGQSENVSVRLAGPDGCVQRTKQGDRVCSLGDLHSARQMLTLGPERLLLTAYHAADLRFEAPEMLRSTSHAVVAFSWLEIPVRILLNAFNHLPDAVETTLRFYDFWYFWGDVHQKTYFDNWQLFHGLVYPTNRVEERNGLLWRSTQALDVEFNVSLEDKSFVMDANTAKQDRNLVRLEPAVSPGSGHRPGQRYRSVPRVLEFNRDQATGWNRHSGSPDIGDITQGIIEEARKRYPGALIKAVLSTSDSWPHTGGVRFAVAQGFPVYILDPNLPLLERVVKAPHTLEPDALAKNPREPQWKIVSDKVEVGGGENRLELYPLRGASTERQYIVYFPDARLLYGSDTLVINDDGSLYDPELMREVAQAVRRANLEVDTIFAMHQGPVPWRQALDLIAKSQRP